MTTRSQCICQGKTKPGVDRTGGYDYPTLVRVEDAPQLFRRHGYFVMRGLITREEVEQMRAEISAIVKKWYEEYLQKGEDGNDWEEIVNRMPAWKEGRVTPQDPEMGIRRLFRMAVHNELFARMARHEKIVPIVTELLGPDVKLLQSMALLKPPGSTEKKWHQDNAYFRLTPVKVMGVWIALDPANCENGCMHLLPSSHGSGIYKHDAPLDFHIDYGMVDLPTPDHVVPIILDPGDALLFHGEMAHYTPPNVSNTRRRSLQLHYAACECKFIKCPKKEEEGGPGTETNPRNGTETGGPQADSDDSKPHYFDCDPDCEEEKYFHYKKGELLVVGKDYGGEYI